MGRGRRLLVRDRLATTGEALGAAGLWLRELAHGRATAGYSVAPRHRGHGYTAEVLLPRHQEIGGRWRDMLRYAATRPT